MCIASSAIYAIISVVGTAVGMIGQNQSRQEQIGQNNAAKEYNNRLAENYDKQAAEVMATSEIQRKMITEGASRVSQAEMVKSRGVLASQRAAAAGSGLGGGSVTVENLAIDEANKSVLDDMYIRFKSEQDKWINERQARSAAGSLRDQASAARQSAIVYQGNNSAINSAAGWNSAASLLGGVTQAADIWYRTKE